MGALWLRAKAERRAHRWGAVGLTVVIALAGGLVMASIAGASRTRSALPRFVESYQAEDLLVYSQGSRAEQTALMEEVAELPGVAETTGDAYGAFAFTDEQGDAVTGRAGFVGGIIAIDDGLFRTTEVPLVVDGRVPSADAVDEVAVNEGFTDTYGLGAGDELTLVAYSQDELEAVANDQPVEPTGPTLPLRIVGVIRQPFDVSIRSSGGGVDSGIVLTPAFWAAHQDEVANYGVEGMVRLEPGVAPGQVETAIVEGFGDVVVERSQGSIATVGETQRAIDLQANALLAAGIAFAVVAAVFILQTVSRRVTPTAGDDAALRSLGWTGRDLAKAAALQIAPIAVGGALGAAVVAVAISPLTPFGTARAAEIDPGIRVDVAPLLLGATALFVLVVVVAAVAGRRATTRVRGRARSGRPARIANSLAAAGLPPTATLAAALPLDPRRRVSTLTAVGGAVVGLAALTAAVTFHDDLARLVDEPQRWGQEWDVTVGTYGDRLSAYEGIEPLRSNPAVGAFSASSSAEFSGDTVEVDGRVTGAVAFRSLEGDLRPTVLAGTLPEDDDEVALGRRTLAAIDKQIGDDVVLSSPARDPIRARITGEVVVPAVLAPDARLGDGAVLTQSTLNDLRPGNDFAAVFVVGFAEGIDHADGVAALAPDFGDTITESGRPPEIESLDRVRGLPGLLAALLAGLAVVTVVHALVTGMRRQRHDLAVLKALGFGRRNLRSLGLLQAVAFSTLAVVIGLPVGLVIGRQAWRQTIQSLGLEIAPTVPLLVWAVIPIAVVGGLLLAAGPAERAARTNPATALRTD